MKFLLDVALRYAWRAAAWAQQNVAYTLGFMIILILLIGSDKKKKPR